MTGLASMLSNCPKAEKDRAERPDSLSSDLILTEKWLSLSRVSQNSAGVVVFLSLPVLLLASLGGEWMVKLLVRKMRPLECACRLLGCLRVDPLDFHTE